MLLIFLQVFPDLLHSLYKNSWSMLYFRYNTVKIQKISEVVWYCLRLLLELQSLIVFDPAFVGLIKSLEIKWYKTDSQIFLCKHSVSQILNPDYFSPVEMDILVTVWSCADWSITSEGRLNLGKATQLVFSGSLVSPEHWPCLSRPPVLLDNIQNNSMYLVFLSSQYFSHVWCFLIQFPSEESSGWSNLSAFLSA